LRGRLLTRTSRIQGRAAIAQMMNEFVRARKRGATENQT
jgi:hypothetical protein